MPRPEPDPATVERILTMGLCALEPVELDALANRLLEYAKKPPNRRNLALMIEASQLTTKGMEAARVANQRFRGDPEQGP